MRQLDLGHPIAFSDHLQARELGTGDAQTVLQACGIRCIAPQQTAQSVVDVQRGDVYRGFHTNDYCHRAVIMQMILYKYVILRIIFTFMILV